jgi:putative flippase GtrA
MTAPPAPAGRPPRWAAFAGVGAIGFAVQLALVALLAGGARLPTALATALAVELTVLHNFAWHECWTWRDRAHGAPDRLFMRLARFHAGTGIVSLAGNVAITVIVVEWFGVTTVVANACAVALLGILNFFVADRFVFEP